MSDKKIKSNKKPSFSVQRVKGFSCPSKWLVSKDGEPIMFCNSQRCANLCITYIEGYNVEIEDKSIKGILDKYRRGGIKMKRSKELQIQHVLSSSYDISYITYSIKTKTLRVHLNENLDINIQSFKEEIEKYCYTFDLEVKKIWINI